VGGHCVFDVRLRFDVDLGYSEVHCWSPSLHRAYASHGLVIYIRTDVRLPHDQTVQAALPALRYNNPQDIHSRTQYLLLSP